MKLARMVRMTTPEPSLKSRRLILPQASMLAMGGALLLASLLVPADLLDAVDDSRLIESMPIDPFVLFLLPPLLNGWGWIAIGVVLTLLLLAFAELLGMSLWFSANAVSDEFRSLWSLSAGQAGWLHRGHG